MLTLKPIDFCPAYNNQVNGYHTQKPSQSPPTLETRAIFGPRKKPSQFRPPTQQPNQFYPYTEIKSKSIPHLEIKSISTTHTNPSRFRCSQPKPSGFRPAYNKHVNFDNPRKTKSIDPHTKNESFSARTQRPCQFRSPLRKQYDFDAPDTKTKLISIQTLNQAILDPHTKPSQLRSLHWNHVNSDPPHWNQVYFDHPHLTKSISMWTPKPCHFRPLLFCVLHIRAHVPVIQQLYVSHKYEHQLVVFFTCPYYSSRTPKILCKYLYHIYILLHGM